MPLLAQTTAAQPAVCFVFANHGESTDRIGAFLAAIKLSLAHVLLDQGTEIPRHYGTRGISVALFLVV